MNDNEIWKQYLEFPFIEGSSLGRVRTRDRFVSTKKGVRFVKGRILKQCLANSGYLYVTFGVNGKKVHRSVHRIIAECFLPNPDNLPQVNHKNCVRDDDRLTNLEWCSISYNARYREEHGISMAEAQGHTLYAINLATSKVLRFSSQGEAGRKLGVSHGSIGMVIRGEHNKAGGYWFTEDDAIEAIKNDKNKLRNIVAGKVPNYSVFAVNLSTLEVLHFPSRTEASRSLGVADSNISAVIKGKLKQAGGYWFTEDGDRATKITKSELHDITTGKTSKCPVLAINLATLEVSRFRSQCEAGRKLGVSHGSIGMVIRGEHNKAGGYWFTSADSNAVEATRNKLGDIVADKIEELMTDKEMQLA